MLNKDRPEVQQALAEFLSDESRGTEKYDRFREKTRCEFLNCPSQIFNETFKGWLNSEYVELFKITRTEKNILETLDPSYWIGRNFHKDLDLYMDEPDLDGAKDLWFDDYLLYSFEVYNELFPFIEEMHSYKIKDILANCEVID